ncbi:uncharacterized protein LOC128391402 [Panonychus citri]|uniref:uncharacterized protein LOC128391402 n=1 Tax=Panonychus citri TaxID=50023 RepID=UPI0023071979|nr:uncharacterized protein LOC128391402 [Panonychus citri]
MFIMLTINCYPFKSVINFFLLNIIILLVNCYQFVSSNSHDSSDLISHCLPRDTSNLNKIIKVNDVEGESSVYLKSSDSEKQLTECVTIIQSSPGFGLIVHPSYLKLSTDNVAINVYQLHLATKSSRKLFNWYGHNSFDSNDQHQIESVACDLAPRDNVTTILITFEPITSNVTWKSVDLRILITSFIPIKDPLASCPGSLYFDCGSGQCIRQSLHCDGFANCGNGIDEHGCSLSIHEIFFIVIAIIIMLLIVIGLIWYARRKEIKEDHESQLEPNKSTQSTITTL